MFPAEFEYYRAETLDEAFELLEQHADAAHEVLAGGHSLLPMMKSGLARPSVLIDIGRIDELQGITATQDAVSVGALTTYAEIADSDTVSSRAPALAMAAGNIGDIQVRNRGTIGGNLAHADPGSDPPAAVLALDGTLLAQGPSGSRRIDAEDFFLGMYTTDLEENELLTGLEIPTHDATTSSAYVKRSNTASGYAVIGVAARVTVNDDTFEAVRIAANGALDYAIRLEPVEAALVGEQTDEGVIREAANRASDDIDGDFMMEDNEASAEYRTELLKLYTERALLAALAAH